MRNSPEGFVNLHFLFKEWEIFSGLLTNLMDVVAECRIRIRTMQLLMYIYSKVLLPPSQLIYKIFMTPSPKTYVSGSHFSDNSTILPKERENLKDPRPTVIVLHDGLYPSMTARGGGGDFLGMLEISGIPRKWVGIFLLEMVAEQHKGTHKGTCQEASP